MNSPGKSLDVWFDHGLGDCVHFAFLMQQYLAAGYKVRVHHEANKAFVFQMAGIAYMPEARNYHKFDYPDDFNCVESGTPWAGNKIKYAMNRHGLPDMGAISEQWQRIREVPTFEKYPVPETAEREVEAFLRDLPRPVFAFHGCGTNLGHMKNLSADHQTLICQNLLAKGGSLIILDWDNRVPKYPHGAVRHLKTDFGHADLAQLAALFKRIDLFVGVDSGPYHFARCFPLKTIGIWTGHHPACCTIPNANAVNLVRNGHGASNGLLREEWNLVEYEDEQLPEIVGTLAADLVRIPGKYPLNIAKETALNSLLRRTNGYSHPGCVHAWRERTFRTIFSEIARFEAPVIVETGCIRSLEDWSAGYSTYLFSFWIQAIGKGKLFSMDISDDNLAFAKRTCNSIPSTISGDSATSLSHFDRSIDFLYLDSADVGVPGFEQHCLDEAVAGLSKLSSNGLIAIDDTWYDNGWRGKGTLAVPWLISHRFSIIDAGYQTVLKRV